MDDSSKTPAWTLKPGDKIKRTKLHDLFGGGRQGGISPCKKSPNVLVFSDPGSGEQHGYFDVWDDDTGVFLYTGEGQRGDQQMKAGNRAIQEHRKDNRALRVFQGCRDVVEYCGEFEVDGDNPFIEDTAPETGGGPLRQVIKFRLVPVGEQLRCKEPLRGVVVPVEQRHVTTSKVPARPESEAERREGELVHDFIDWLDNLGVKAGRLQCRPDGSGRPLLSDLYIDERDQLIEAKGLVSRAAIRMAIGQLLDYRRFAPRPPSLAVLLPRQPGPDLRSLLEKVEIDCIWKERDQFLDSADGRFVS